MPIKKLTDNEIKKAFMICNNLEDGYCSDCPYEYCDRCIRQVAINTLDLINRQDEKINRIEAENERLTHITRSLIGEIKAEAITDFVKELEETFGYYDWENKVMVYPEEEIDDLLKEKVGK